MATYRRYKAGYDFEGRDDTEISMNIGHTLRVGRKPSGEWPDPEKFMKGINEITGAEGEFPGGAYVEYVEEFIEESLYDEPPPPTPPRRGPSVSKLQDPEPESNSIAAPIPRPRPRVKRPGSTFVEEPLSPVQQSPSPEPTHNWVQVTCQLPFSCTACEWCVWACGHIVCVGCGVYL